MKLVARFVSGQKVKTVGEDLPAFGEARRADDYRFLVLPIENSTRTDGGIGVAFADLVALLTEKRALLRLNDPAPVASLLLC